MREVKEDHYILGYGIQLKFKDKSAKFLVPFRQFSDIPKVTMDIPEFVEFVVVLPEYAHEKKRYFQKGATIEGFIKYLEKLDVPLSDTQKEYFENMSDKGMLRLYREVLENKSEYMVRAYFLNIIGISMKLKSDLEERLFRFFQESELVNAKRVLPTKNFPEWMKKIGGIVVEQADGEFQRIKKPQRIVVDPQMDGKKEFLFLPSKKLMESDLSASEWQEAFMAELRERYKQHAPIFQQYAKNVMRGKTELVCGCENNNHQERCTVQILQGVFDRIINS